MKTNRITFSKSLLITITQYSEDLQVTEEISSNWAIDYFDLEIGEYRIYE